MCKLILEELWTSVRSASGQRWVPDVGDLTLTYIIIICLNANLMHINTNVRYFYVHCYHHFSLSHILYLYYNS